MRLIDVHDLQLEDVPDASNISYAILSHTWRQASDGGEIKFQEFQRGSGSVGVHDPTHLDHYAGFQKVKAFCDVTASHGLQRAWADTVCIDQTNPAELSLSINSMFQWYKQSAECLVYLADVTKSDDHGWEAQFRDSRWFRRGWTLQELIAPSTVLFYDCDWKLLGTREELCATISSITTIPEEVLSSGAAALHTACVAQKMAWASMRQTTAPEDVAYSLLGLFDVFMPLIYGEGAERAFHRLQKEILEQTDDESIFAWRESPSADGRGAIPQFSGLLASSPAAFRREADICLPPIRLRSGRQKLSKSRGGLDLELLVNRASLGRGLHYAWLNCVRFSDTALHFTAVSIILLHLTASQFCRVYPDQLRELAGVPKHAKMQPLFVKHRHSWPRPTRGCLFGPSASLMSAKLSMTFRSNFRHDYQYAVHPFSWFPRDAIPRLDDKRIVLMTPGDTPNRHTEQVELMADVFKVEAIPEFVVTFALQVKSLPGSLAPEVDDFPTVTVHCFDVVFGYNCLANTAGTRTQQLSPWVTFAKHRPQPPEGGDPRLYAQRMAEWRNDLRAIVQENHQETYDIPLSDYQFPKGYARRQAIDVISRLSVKLEDEIYNGMVVHTVLIGPEELGRTSGLL